MLRTKRKIVISLHGIRTRGSWQKDLSPLITEQGWIYYPLDYGWFSLLGFVPAIVRGRKVEWFRQRYNEVQSRYPDVIPSIVAHSFGTWILCKAIKKHAHLRFDKIILCGSIAPCAFDWRRAHQRNQFTAVRNDVAKCDFWARNSKWFAWGTGDSGFRGFDQKEPFVEEHEYEEYGHSCAFGYEHYLGEWVPFLGRILPFADGQTPADSEEPVSPYDAARWSAITYFKQYIFRVADAFQRNEVFDDTGEVRHKDQLVVLVPATPGEASPIAAGQYYKEKQLRKVIVGRSTPRTAYIGRDGFLYDIPTTINSLLALDHRTDEELVDAVREFRSTLEKLINHPRSDVKHVVKVVSLDQNHNP